MNEGYVDEPNESVDVLIDSATLYLTQGTQLINEWHSCRTENERRKLIPRLEYILQKLSFEKNEIKKLIDLENDSSGNL